MELGPSTQPGRIADIRISRGAGRTRRDIWIEASVVDDFSLGARGDMSFQDRLVPYLQMHLDGFEVGGRLHVDPGPAEEEQLLRAATTFWELCRSGQVPAELVIPRILELWAVRVGDQESKQMMLDRGHHDGFVGGVMDNPLKRCVRVVRAKLGQLPLARPGLIVLQPPPMLFKSFTLDVIADIIGGQVADSPAVVGVALIQWVARQGRRPARIRSHPSGVTVITVPDRLIFLKQLGLILNPGNQDSRSARFIAEMV